MLTHVRILVGHRYNMIKHSPENWTKAYTINGTRTVYFSILHKLAHVQVVINCQYFIAQMCTWEDLLACRLRWCHESEWTHNNTTVRALGYPMIWITDTKMTIIRIFLLKYPLFRFWWSCLNRVQNGVI